MTILGQLRRNRRLIRSVFAVFVLALLQTALVPCVVAGVHAGLAVSMTGHSAAVDGTVTGMQAAATTAMPGCVYCPSQHEQSGVADSAPHDCLYPHESRVDSGNAHQLQLEHWVLHPTFISSSVFSFLLEPSNASPPPRHLLAPIARRPFALTYCVQLK